MARLPTKAELSGPVSLRSGRAIASVDTTGLGRGIAAAGDAISTIGADMQRQQDAVGVSMAEANFTEGSLALENRYQDDPNYESFGQRAPEDVSQIVRDAGALITNSRTRERWMADAAVRAVRVKDGITGIGRRKYQEAKTTGLDTSLQKNVGIYSDPNTPDDVRSKVRGDIEGSITVAEQSGLLSPSEAAARRERFLAGGDLLRAKLIAATNPDAIPGIGNDVTKSLLRDSEGFRSKPYWDVNAYRVGYGSDTVTKADGSVVRVTPGMTVTRADAERDLDRRSKEFATTAQRQVGAREWGALPENARAALTSVAYNYGSLPAPVVNSAKSGDIASVAAAVAALGDDNGGVNAGRRAREASLILGESGGISEPDWYTRLSPEDRQTVRDEALANKTAMTRDAVARQKAEYTAYKDKYELSILTGRVLSEQPILSDATLNDGDKASLLRTFRTQMEDTLATAAAVDAFSGGKLRVDPYDTKGTKTVDNVYDAVSKVAPDQIQTLTEDIVRQTGVVPRQALSLIRQGMDATDVNAVVAAGQAAQRLASINPAALARRDGGAAVQSFADDFNHYVNMLNLSPEQAAQKVIEARDPAQRLQRKALEPVVKEYLKGLEGYDLAGQFDDSFMGVAGNPELGFDAASALGIQAEFKAIAEDQFYRSGGDPELATSRAVSEMKRLYGTTALTGKPVLMKHPPERYWPAFNFSSYGPTLVPSGEKSLDYATFQLRRDMSDLYPNLDMDNVQLVTTPETDRMVKRGEMPGYAVLYRDPNGVLQTIPGALWRPDTTDIQSRENVIDSLDETKALSTARRTQEVLRRDQEKRMMMDAESSSIAKTIRGEVVE